MSRVLSGMRPTGKLHLGHLHGALKNWISLQKDNECFFFIADWHALTSDYDRTEDIGQNIYEMVQDWLAVGLDPNKSTLFLQSALLEHAELHLLLSMVTPLSWLERNPTYKEQLAEVVGKDLYTYGFLGYPVLQAADILIYKADKVPVGADQVPHLELAREIARRFNNFYGPVFPEPQAILTEDPKIPGTDGRKMSKSYGNAIFLSDPPDVIEKKILPMMTDPARKKRTDRGNPELCPVFSIHKVYSPRETIAIVDENCRSAGFGCIDCKKLLIPSIVRDLEPIRTKRAEQEKKPHLVNDVLEQGSARARKVVQKTMADARKAIGLLRWMDIG